MEALEGVGYKDGGNLFGAPYDFRYGPAPRGQPAQHFAHFVSSLRLLVERASARNGNKPVILVSHSQGGINAMAFLDQSPLPWRRRYVKHFVMVSTGAGGIVTALRALASSVSHPPPPGDVLSLFGNTGRSFESTFLTLPSPKVFAHTPLVITRARNYSAYDIPELLAAAGFSDDEVARYRTRTLPGVLNFSAPIVPVTCINGVGVPTPELVYWDDIDAEPRVVYGDGDGNVNLASVLALDTVIGKYLGQDYYKSVLIPNATHTGILADDFARQRVVSEILQANTDVY